MALIPWLVAAYAGICAAAYFGNRLLMYIPDPARITPAEAGSASDLPDIDFAAMRGSSIDLK